MVGKHRLATMTGAVILALLLGLVPMMVPAQPVAARNWVCVFDTSRETGAGNMAGYQPMVNDLETRGWVFREQTTPLTKRDLKGANSYWVVEPDNGYTGRETRIIQRFVYNGGSFVLLGDDLPAAAETQLNRLMAPWGIRQTPQGSNSGRWTNIGRHPVTRGVRAYWQDSGGASFWCERSRRAQVVIWTRDRVPVVCVSQYGRGRVVVVSDEFSFSGQLYFMEGNQTLAHNWCNWISMGRR